MTELRIISRSEFPNDSIMAWHPNIFLVYRWGFPEKGGTQKHHPLLDGIFHSFQPSSELGVPNGHGNAHIWQWLKPLGYQITHKNEHC